MACLDTSFLIDLMKEQKKKKPGPATAKLLEPIGVIDTLIASVALEYDQVLVSRNVKHFSRVPFLKTESY